MEGGEKGKREGGKEGGRGKGRKGGRGEVREGGKEIEYPVIVSTRAQQNWLTPLACTFQAMLPMTSAT